MARTELRSHPKFKRLVRRLNLPAPYVMGLLECMWQCGYQSGDDLLGTAEDVETAAEWPGEPGKFFEASRADWLDERNGKWHIHDLYDHAPSYVQKKMRRRNNKHLQHKMDNNCDHVDQNFDHMADKSGQTGAVPNPTQPNPTNNPPTPHGGVDHDDLTALPLDEKAPAPVTPATMAHDAPAASTTSAEPAARPARPRDPVWDCVAKLWHEDTVAKAHVREVGRIVSDFKSLSATPEEICARLARMKTAWPTLSHTARALVKHWHQFAAASPTETFDAEVYPGQSEEILGAPDAVEEGAHAH